MFYERLTVFSKFAKFSVNQKDYILEKPGLSLRLNKVKEINKRYQGLSYKVNFSFQRTLVFKMSYKRKRVSIDLETKYKILQVEKEKYESNATQSQSFNKHTI